MHFLKKYLFRLHLITFCFGEIFTTFDFAKKAKMNKLLFIVLPVIFFNCKGVKNDSYFTNEKAIQYFKSVEEICNRDNGKLLGKNLYGPLMFIDRNTRKITANQPDKEGILKESDGIYTGFYPKELLIFNNPVKFGGTIFGMAPLPIEEDEYRIKNRAIHSLVHRIQPEVPESVSSGFGTNNMDDKEARLWLKLEWKALRKALTSEGDNRLLAIRDALIFRGSNRELYQKYAASENLFESYEGLPTFIYTLLCSKSQEEFKTRLFENLDKVYGFPIYSRSYGSINGALYTTLLYEKGYDLKKIMDTSFDFGTTVKEAYGIQLPTICRDVAGSLAVSYDIDIINKEEEERLKKIKESIHQQISIFTEKPIVFLELESPYFDFEPENIRPLDTLGTLYTSIRVSDNWGKLTVDQPGCLVSNNLKTLRITAKGFKADKSHVSGDGWVLNLNSDWELINVEQNYFVRKLMP